MNILYTNSMSNPNELVKPKLPCFPNGYVKGQCNLKHITKIKFQFVIDTRLTVWGN